MRGYGANALGVEQESEFVNNLLFHAYLEAFAQNLSFDGTVYPVKLWRFLHFVHHMCLLPPLHFMLRSVLECRMISVAASELPLATAAIRGEHSRSPVSVLTWG